MMKIPKQEYTTEFKEHMTITGLTAVIPTLGGDQIRETLMHLNSGGIAPAEIIIAIPKLEAFRVREYEQIYANVKILPTICRGQVAQRVEGFLAARYSFVLQIDDDVHVTPSCISEMLLALQSLGKNVVVGPIFIDQRTREPFSSFPTGFKGKVADTYLSICWGLPKGLARMGQYSSLGMAISIDPKYCSDAIKATSWLAGGCVLGYRDQLIKDNFYPISGKAYAEDLLHSAYRSKRGIDHFVVLSAMAAIEKPEPVVGFFEFYKEFSARVVVGKILGCNRYRLVVLLIFDLIRRSFR